MAYVSRAGEKLAHALKTFNVDVHGKVCADFGASTGGFVDCLLQHGAQKVYAVETGYGVLDWQLRNDERVVVMERTNAMHVALPELVAVLTIDTSWTKLKNIIPNALTNLVPNGYIIALIKPHYEALPSMLHKGKLPDHAVPDIVAMVKIELQGLGLEILGETESPILGNKGKNREFLVCLHRKGDA